MAGMIARASGVVANSGNTIASTNLILIILISMIIVSTLILVTVVCGCSKCSKKNKSNNYNNEPDSRFGPSGRSYYYGEGDSMLSFARDSRFYGRGYGGRYRDDYSDVRDTSNYDMYDRSRKISDDQVAPDIYRTLKEIGQDAMLPSIREKVPSKSESQPGKRISSLVRKSSSGRRTGKLSGKGTEKLSEKRAESPTPSSSPTRQGISSSPISKKSSPINIKDNSRR